jgi:ABC-type Na+ efflux pump permease subunit
MPQQPNIPPVSVGEWLGTLLLLLIPVANIVLMFVWAFGERVNPNKSNFFKAYLIYFAIALAISFIFGILLGGILAAFLSADHGNYFPW